MPTRSCCLWCLLFALSAGCGGAPEKRKSSSQGPAPPAADIWTAASHGNVEAVRQHLAAGKDINATFVAPGVAGSGGTPLHIAIMADQREVFDLLLREKANLHAKADDSSGGTPLHWAVVFGRVQMAKDLIEAGARVNEPDKNQFTALDATFYEPERFARSERTIAKLLKEKGGTGQLMDALQGQLWEAVAGGDLEAIQQYLAAGADVDGPRATSGATPLMLAAAAGRKPAVELLLENKARVNDTSNTGETALSVAAMFGEVEVVDLLLKRGADVNAINHRGQTPFDIATSKWTPAFEEDCRAAAAALQVDFDAARVKAVSSKVAERLRSQGGKKSIELRN